MEQLPADDPFRFLFPPRNPTLSQEEELRECPFARESEEFSDSDSQSTWMSSSPPNGIIMESPPDSDPISADKFLTPPEHHFSNASDSDILKTPPPLPHSDLTVALSGCGHEREVDDFEDLGTGKDFGEEGDLGFGNEVDKVDLEEGLCDCVIKDHETEVFGSDFGQIGVLGLKIVSRECTEKLELEGGIDCAKSIQETANVDTDIIHLNSEETVVFCGDDKTEVVASDFDKNEVLGGEIVSKEVTEKLELGVGADCAKRGQETDSVDTESIHLDSEETVVLSGDDEVNVVDEMKVQSRVELERDRVFGAGGGLGFWMDENLDEELCDYIVSDIVTRVGCEFDNISVLDTEFMSEKVTVCEEELKLGGSGIGTGCVGNMDHIENTETDIIPDSKEHVEEIKLNNENLVTQLDLAGKDTTEGDEVSTRKPLKENVGDNKGLNVRSRGQNELVDGENDLIDGEGDCEVRKQGNPTEYCQDMSGIENCGHKEDVNLQRSGKRKRRAGKGKLQASDKINLGKSKEDSKKFKYAKPSDGEVQGKDERQKVNDETVSVEGNIPLSNTEKGPLSDKISLMNLLKKAGELLKRDMDPDTKDDLIETLEKKGFKFPHPSWWPPEGFK